MNWENQNILWKWPMCTDSWVITWLGLRVERLLFIGTMVKRLAVYRSENRSGRLIGAHVCSIYSLQLYCAKCCAPSGDSPSRFFSWNNMLLETRLQSPFVLRWQKFSTRKYALQCKNHPNEFQCIRAAAKKHASSKQRAMLELMTTTKKMSAMERQSFVEQRQETRSKRWNDENYLLSSRCRWQFCTLQFNSLSLSIQQQEKKKREKEISDFFFVLFLIIFF